MKYFVELSTEYEAFRLGRLYPVINGYMTADENGDAGAIMELEDETGYVFNYSPPVAKLTSHDLCYNIETQLFRSGGQVEILRRTQHTLRGIQPGQTLPGY